MSSADKSAIIEKPPLAPSPIVDKGPEVKPPKPGAVAAPVPPPNPMKMAMQDLMPGGLADNMPRSAFDAKQLAKGLKAELEHTTDAARAEEIARDHLAEHPEYYQALEEMENELEAEKKTAKAHKLSRRMKFRGLDISIETDKGEKRHWYDPHNDTKGTTTMKFPYGYVRRTQGTDGDHVDVYVGPNEQAKNVYIVDQMKAPDFKAFDEQKVMIGFDSAAAAKKAYLDHYNSPKFFKSMKTMPFEDFKTKVLKTMKAPTKIANVTTDVGNKLIQMLRRGGAGSVDDAAEIARLAYRTNSMTDDAAAELVRRVRAYGGNADDIETVLRHGREKSVIDPVLSQAHAARAGRAAEGLPTYYGPGGQQALDDVISSAKAPGGSAAPPTPPPATSATTPTPPSAASGAPPTPPPSSAAAAGAQQGMTDLDARTVQELMRRAANQAQPNAVIRYGVPAAVGAAGLAGGMALGAHTSQPSDLETYGIPAAALAAGGLAGYRMGKQSNANLGDPNFWQGGQAPAAAAPPPPATVEEAIQALPPGVFQGMHKRINPDGQQNTTVKASPDAIGMPEALSAVLQADPTAKIEIETPQSKGEGGGGGPNAMGIPQDMPVDGAGAAPPVGAAPKTAGLSIQQLLKLEKLVGPSTMDDIFSQATKQMKGLSRRGPRTGRIVDGKFVTTATPPPPPAEAFYSAGRQRAAQQLGIA